MRGGGGSYGMPVTSSEKSDTSGNYQRFHINAMPYPGCEFFRDFRDNGHSGRISLSLSLSLFLCPIYESFFLGWLVISV